MSKKIYAFIFARGGSKGLPNKNIKLLGGLPLIAHSIKLAKNMKEIDKLFVSTDSDEIASIAKDLKAEIINRPKHLATDNSPEWLSWQHAIRFVYKKEGEFDIFTSLPATSPLRRKKDVISCLNSLDHFTDITVAIKSSERSPWFNMVQKNEDGFISLISKDLKIKRRQDAPKSFDLTTVAYVARPQFVLNSTGIWDGRIKGIEVPKLNSIDIDDEYDFKIAELLFNELSLNKIAGCYE